MTNSSEVPARLKAALADRYEPIRELGRGGMATDCPGLDNAKALG
jgi:hypothetical protein